MPTLSSMTIIFLFCIFLHSCNGRNLRVEINEAAHKKQLQDHNKENNVISSLNKLDDAERGSKVEKIRINDNSQKQSDSEAIAEEMKEQRMLRSEDDVLHGHGSLGSVSFRVPRNNEGSDHHPGFNLDYSPPKTHPPIHN